MKKQKKKKNKFKKHLPEIIYGTCCVAVFSTMAFSIWHFLIKPDAQQVNINAPETPTTKIYAEVTATVPTETIQTIQTSENTVYYNGRNFRNNRSYNNDHTGNHGNYRSEKDHCRKNSC